MGWGRLKFISSVHLHGFKIVVATFRKKCNKHPIVGLRKAAK